MTDPTIPETRAVALRIEELSQEQIDLIKTTYAKGATDLELKLFVTVCNALQLNPFLGQIHAVKRWSSADNKEVMAYQTGIGGFRLQAQRSKSMGGPTYRGQTDPEWCAKDGNWVPLWTSDDPPFAARVGVHVEGFVEPIYAIAEYKRLVQTRGKGEDKRPNVFWERGSPFQLAKCAEAAAIRRAFPGETSRLFLPEEMYDMPEEKDITPPMTVDEAKEEAKKALTPPPTAQPTLPKPPNHPDVVTADKAIPKGEEIVSPERREEVKKHLQNIGVQDIPPPEMTETEAGMLTECKRRDSAGRRLDEFLLSRDKHRTML